MNPPPRVLNTFRRTQYGKSLAVFFGVDAALDLAWLLAFARTLDHLLSPGLLLIALVIMAWRAWRSGVVIQTQDRLLVRGISWTHRFSKDRVKRFAVEVGPTWPRQRSGSFLVAELTDGGLRALKDFNAPSSDAGQRDIEEVATALNAGWQLG